MVADLPIFSAKFVLKLAILQTFFIFELMSLISLINLFSSLIQPRDKQFPMSLAHKALLTHGYILVSSLETIALLNLVP